MKRTILTFVAVATLGLFMISCGGSGVGDSGISNKHLGKYPGLMADKAKHQEQIRQDYKYAEDRSDVVKISKKDDKFKEEWKAAVEKELTALIGKEIPTEAKNLPFKISKNVTIKALSSSKENLEAEFEVEFTQEVKAKRSSDAFMMDPFYIHFVDTKGADCKRPDAQQVLPSTLWGTGWGEGNKPITKKVGDKLVYKVTISVWPKEAEKWADFDKIVLSKEK